MLLKIFILIFILLVIGFLIFAAHIIAEYFRVKVAEVTTREEKREIRLDLISALFGILVDVFISSYGLYKLITTNSIRHAVVTLAIIVLMRQGTLKFVKKVFKKIFKR